MFLQCVGVVYFRLLQVSTSVTSTASSLNSI
uniref:Uncharacterized protein n=1 Tax=Myoviridae sp. ctLnO19 TaxID=2825085 RepID=A0A8S5P1J2_9CAUD|nr:MAG TPA: hypothetical protein [Myoviridae sp. ctLnO19]DAJ69034.1 MAG TPA: hypothetical protein [Caudoviricetes sp.]